jgi:hypothetical protein
MSNISICAGEATLGHVMMSILIIAFIGVVIHGLHGKGQNTQPSLTAPLAPVTL